MARAGVQRGCSHPVREPARRFAPSRAIGEARGDVQARREICARTSPLPSVGIAPDYPFLNVLWTMIIFFAWVVYIWMIIVILTDVFRRRDIGGWAKAAWCVFMIVLPFIGVLTYLITQHEGMADRRVKDIHEQ